LNPRQIPALAPWQDVRFGSKADICAAQRDVRFTPDSDRKSGLPHKAMSALPPKADMCSATRDVRFGPKADIWHRSKFGEDSAPCGRKQSAWKRGHDTTNNARDERDQCVAASAFKGFNKFRERH